MRIKHLLEERVNSLGVAEEIKQRVGAINNKRQKGQPRLTLLQLMSESGVSVFTYRSWRQGRNPSEPSLARILSVLQKYEGAA